MMTIKNSINLKKLKLNN